MVADIRTGKQNGDLVLGLPAEALPTSENGWPLRPFQIVSLYEMIEFGAAEFFGLLNRLISIRKDLENRQHPALTDVEQVHMIDHADKAELVCAQYDIDVAYYTDRLRRKVSDPDQWTYSVASAVDALKHCVIKELIARKFLYMPHAEAEYYEQEELFGLEVKSKFPQANQEITIAGNCCATGNHTASVFHLMRAVEVTARYMIKKLGASKYLVNSKGARVPVELCDWHTLIQAMEKGLSDLSIGISTSKYKKRKHEHFSHALATFRHFKNAWRNHVSHTRELYKPGKAKDIMDNTRQFMQHLASDF